MLDDLTRDEMEKLARLRCHLQDGGTARLHEAAIACGISSVEIDRWLQEGRVRQVNDGARAETAGRCSVCGQGSERDLCDECRARLLTGVRDDNPSGGSRRHESAADIAGGASSARGGASACGRGPRPG